MKFVFLFICFTLNLFPQDKQASKKELAFESSTFMNSGIYKLTLEELNSRLKGHELGGVGTSLSHSNNEFPSAKRWGLRYDKNGIKRLSFDFFKGNPTEEKRANKVDFLIDKLNKQYGEFFKSGDPYYRSKTIHYYWKTKTGLSIILETDTKPDSRSVELIVSDYFSSIAKRYRKYDPELLFKNKQHFSIDTFFEPLLYTVPMSKANLHLKRRYAGEGEEFFKSPVQKSRIFTNADFKKTKIVYDENGLKYIRLFFPADKNTVEAIHRNLLELCKKTFGFKSYGGSLPPFDRYKKSTGYNEIGLRVVVEFINIAEIGHYVTLKVSDDYKKLDLEKVEPRNQEPARPEPVRPVNPIVRMVPKQELPATLSINDLLKEEQKFFNLTKENFEKVCLKKLRAKWTDKFRTSSRSTVPIDFFEFKSKETLFHFSNNALKKMVLMIYNKGDQEDSYSERKFAQLVNSLKSRIEAFAGKKGIYKLNAGLAKNYLYWWSTSTFLIKLESNYTKTSKGFSSEYIRISFMKPVRGLNNVNIDQASIETLTNQDLKGRVINDADGSVYIAGVPMVDQGQKGYCACAATARLLNYYGREIDQHDIAKLAGTDKLGTGIDDLQKALQIISSKLRLNIKQLTKCYLSNERDYKRFIIKLEREFEKQGYQFGNVLKVKELKHVFSILAAKDRRYTDFKKSIMSSINGGKPVAWALALGIVPEPEIPQANGGHMRLIIGYNEKTEEIFYTDSWGAGHEKKSMDMKSAFWISSALLEIRPR